MTTTPTTAAPDPVRVALTSNQLALLIELGKGRELCHSEDGEIAWLDTARNGDRWFDIDWKDMAALRDAGYLRSAEDHRFHVELISEAGNRALARAMQEAMSAQGGGEPTPKQLRDAYAYSDLICPTTHSIEAEMLGVWRFLNGQVARPAPEGKDAGEAEEGEDDDAAVNADIANSVIDWLAERDLVYPAEGVSAGSIIEALDWHETELQRPCRDPEELLREMICQPPTPAPAAASEELVERLTEPAEADVPVRICRLMDEAAARIAELEAVERSYAEMVLALDQAQSRATAAEAERDALQEEITYLRYYGNKDCVAMADEALDDWRANGRPAGGLAPPRAALRPEAKGGREDVG